MRTLEDGLVKVEDRFELVDRHAAGVSVAATLDLSHGRSSDLVLLQILQSMPEFAEEGKRELAKKLSTRNKQSRISS
jgi:MOSC domain-containing protein YiiM